MAKNKLCTSHCFLITNKSMCIPWIYVLFMRNSWWQWIQFEICECSLKQQQTSHTYFTDWPFFIWRKMIFDICWAMVWYFNFNFNFIRNCWEHLLHVCWINVLFISKQILSVQANQLGLLIFLFLFLFACFRISIDKYRISTNICGACTLHSCWVCALFCR